MFLLGDSLYMQALLSVKKYFNKIFQCRNIKATTCLIPLKDGLWRTEIERDLNTKLNIILSTILHRRLNRNLSTNLSTKLNTLEVIRFQCNEVLQLQYSSAY